MLQKFQSSSERSLGLNHHAVGVALSEVGVVLLGNLLIEWAGHCHTHYQHIIARGCQAWGQEILLLPDSVPLPPGTRDSLADADQEQAGRVQLLHHGQLVLLQVAVAAGRDAMPLIER